MHGTATNIRLYADPDHLSMMIKSGLTGSGCVASLLFLDFGEQLVYYLRRVDPYQTAK